MLDLKLIDKQPELVKRSLERRGEDTSIVDELVSLNARRRNLIRDINELKAQKNELSSRIARAVESERQELISKSKQLSERISTMERELKELETRISDILLGLPNLVADDVPDGVNAKDNVIVHQEGVIREFDFEPRPHWEIGEKLGLIDFERGIKIAGTRAYILKGSLARLERALINFFLDYHVKNHGYYEIYPPFMTKREALIGAGQLPKFHDNLYHDDESDMWFVPTAEVPLTNLYRDEILPPDILPLCYVAYTPCFRKERAHAGREVRGLKRLHQFDKVEMYKFTTPETSERELERMVQDACDILRELELPFRIVKLCSGDLGFTAMKTYDIEVWAPGVRQWLEVSSVSNCGDYQARRANIRYRPKPGAKPRYVHTLNGSGLALPRVVIAILENCQLRDGRVKIPKVLVPYMGGIEYLEPTDPYKPR